MKKINLAVIFGGKSDEHEVSLSSATGVIAALNKDKYNVLHIAISRDGKWLVGSDAKKYLEIGKKHGIESDEVKNFLKDKENALGDFAKGKIDEKKIDLVLPILHGPYGEDGKIQGMLEMLGMKYVFSRVLTHALAMNKVKAKIVVERFGVPVAEDRVIDKSVDVSMIASEIDFPVVIKPVELGSSVGVSIAKNKKEFVDGVKKGFSYSEELILEEYVGGREFTVTVMGGDEAEALAVTEIIPVASEFYDYKAKYEEGGSKHICPAKIPENIEKEMKKHAVEAFNALGCKDLSRADFIWDPKSGRMIFIEINTIPGMTPTSLAPEAAAVAGMNFTEFLDRIIAYNI
ncbi:MAG: D-alanine--D-alanine ligase [Candidatus Moranbacteria bacterium]|nr:D-alanine--D-alanine ligase [Candidatus Moranbacteria bacterium]